MHDDELRVLLRTLEHDQEPDPAFVDALFNRLATRRGGRGAGRVLLLVAALLAVLVTGVTLGSRLIPPPAAMDATPTPSASATPTASLTPSATEMPTAIPSAPTPAPSTRPAPREILPSGAKIRVTGTGLRIRAFPSLSADIVTAADAGEILYTSAPDSPRLAPIVADGFEWYPVEYAVGYSGWPEQPPDGELVLGYVAARSATEWHVELVEPDCPSSIPDIETLVSLTGYERVACLGDRSVTYEGTYSCPQCDSLAHPYDMEPEWLAAWRLNLEWFGPGWDEPSAGRIVVVTPPDVPAIGETERGQILRVTGHFNDRRAAECTITPLAAAGPAAAPHPEATEWYCRSRFVVERWEVIGTDPAFNDLVPN